jgi:hypothetical protein
MVQQHQVWDCIRKFFLVVQISKQPLSIVISLVSAFTSLALWSSIPLTLRLLFTFQRYQGLYFWSICITTWALNVRAIGFLLRYIVPTVPWELSTTMFELGWVGMVSGFSFVLYSRLSILVWSRPILRFTLTMIILDGVLLHTATMILVYGSSIESAVGSPNRAQWNTASRVMDRLQAVFFTLQEFIITCFYMKAAWDHLQEPRLQNEAAGLDQRARKVYRYLITVQLLVLAMDIVVAVLACAGYFAIKGIIFSFTYSVKLELEFVILNQLVAISRQGITRVLSIPQESEPGFRNPSSTATALPSPIEFQKNDEILSQPDLRH